MNKHFPLKSKQKMETEYKPDLDWTVTLRRIDSGSDHRINVRGHTITEAAAKASIKAEDRFSWVVKVEVLE